MCQTSQWWWTIHMSPKSIANKCIEERKTHSFTQKQNHQIPVPAVTVWQHAMQLTLRSCVALLLLNFDDCPTILYALALCHLLFYPATSQDCANQQKTVVWMAAPIHQVCKSYHSISNLPWCNLPIHAKPNITNWHIPSCLCFQPPPLLLSLQWIQQQLCIQCQSRWGWSSWTILTVL